jgi:HK97 family phage major capsid protein
VWENLVGNVPIPKQASLLSAYWLARQQACPESDTTFQQTILTPHRCSGIAKVGKELLFQSSVGVENFIRGELLSAVGLAIDLAAIDGRGGPEPLGAMNTDGINTVTFSGAATWAKACAFEAAIGADNGEVGPLGIIANTTVREKWRTTVRATGQGFIWTDDNTVAGSRAVATNQVPDNRVLAAAWNAVIIGLWSDSMDVLSNPYTEDATGVVRFVINAFADVAIPLPSAICASTDSGAA